MLTAHEIIKAMLRTEKSSFYEPAGQYLFLVDTCANKLQIKRAVEEVYKVKVKSVNTLISRGKLKRVRYHYGRTPETKKAVVTLKEGFKIETAT